MKNYFTLLNIEEIYDIDLKILDKQYFAMLSQYHPDRAENTEIKQQYLNISIDLNKAYLALKSPLTRAEYLLSLHNVHLDKNSNDKIELNTIWDEMEIIENSSDKVFLTNLFEQKLLIQKEEFYLLTQAFQDQNFQEATNIVIKLKYLVTLLNNIQNKIKLCK